MRNFLCAAGVCVFVFAATAQEGDTGLFANAVKAQQEGRYEQAIEDYRRFLKAHPNSPDAWANLGAAFAHTGQFASAVEADESALKLDPANAAIRMNLGLAYYKQSAFGQAEVQFEAVHAKQPADARTAVLLADCAAHLGQDQRVIQVLSPMEASQPGNADIEYELGTALLRQRKPQEGAGLLEKVGQATNNAAAYMLAGSTFLDLNDFERAQRDLEEARRLDPKLPGIHTLCGAVLDKLGQSDKAELELREALRINPDDFRANLLLGAILLNRRELENARPYLEHALALNEKAPMAHYELGLLQTAQGDHEGAVKQLEMAEKEDPNWLQPHIRLAALYFRVHREQDGERERKIVDELTAVQNK